MGETASGVGGWAHSLTGGQYAKGKEGDDRSPIALGLEPRLGEICAECIKFTVYSLLLTVYCQRAAGETSFLGVKIRTA